jgi:hypothetical protein
VEVAASEVCSTDGLYAGEEDVRYEGLVAEFEVAQGAFSVETPGETVEDGQKVELSDEFEVTSVVSTIVEDAIEVDT